MTLVPMRSAQPEPGPCNVVSVPPWAALPLPTCGGETEAQGGNAPAAAELRHGRARPGLDPVLHFCVWQVGSEVLSNLWPVPADWVSRGLPCPAHPKSRNVEEVCRFPELPARKPLTYQAKQLIAREVEVEKMRRVEASARARDGPQVSLPRPWAEQGPRSGHEPCRGPA